MSKHLYKLSLDNKNLFIKLVSNLVFAQTIIDS